jgi:hypothetical protein
MGTQIPEWSRTKVKARDLNRCLRCGCPAGEGRGEWHHRRTRRVVDQHRHCPCNGAWLCFVCHAQVHAAPFEARAEGFIVSRHLSEPGLVPVIAHFGSIFLLCDGTYRYEINTLKRSNEG